MYHVDCNIETWTRLLFGSIGLASLHLHEVLFHVHVKLCRFYTHSWNLFAVCFAVKGLRTVGLYRGTTQDTMALLKMEQATREWTQYLR